MIVMWKRRDRNGNVVRPLWGKTAVKSKLTGRPPKRGETVVNLQLSFKYTVIFSYDLYFLPIW